MCKYQCVYLLFFNFTGTEQIWIFDCNCFSPLIYLLIILNITVLSHVHFYVNHISYHDEEHEFLVNNNAVLKFDINSVKPVDPKYPQKGYTVDAYWLGQAQAQTISPTNTGKRIKRR